MSPSRHVLTGAISRKYLVNALLRDSNEAPWSQASAASGGASLGGVEGGGQRSLEWNGAIQKCLSRDEHRERFFEDASKR